MYSSTAHATIRLLGLLLAAAAALPCHARICVLQGADPEGVVVLVVYKQPGAARLHARLVHCCWPCSDCLRGQRGGRFLRFSTLAQLRLCHESVVRGCWLHRPLPVPATSSATNSPVCGRANLPFRRGPDRRPGHCKGHCQQRLAARVCAAADGRAGCPRHAAAKHLVSGL